MTFLTVPKYGGTSAAVDMLRALLTAALTTNKRIALVGDSHDGQSFRIHTVQV